MTRGGRPVLTDQVKYLTLSSVSFICSVTQPRSEPYFSCLNLIHMILELEETLRGNSMQPHVSQMRNQNRQKTRNPGLKFWVQVFFFFFLIFLTFQYCIGFAIYQHESTTGIHVFPWMGDIFKFTFYFLT